MTTTETTCSCGCGQKVTASNESYIRDGWRDDCAQADVWANTPSGRKAMNPRYD